MTLEERVHIHYDHLNEGDREIWETIYANKKETADMTIEQCAYACSVSRTTILRFAKKLGLSGYTEFRYLLKAENDRPEVKAAGTGVDLLKLQDVFTRFLDDLPAWDHEGFNRMLDNAGRVFLVPSGHTQDAAAAEFQNLLMVHTAKDVVIANSKSRRAAMSESVKPTDLVVFISQSGQNETLVELARELRWKKVPIITFTQVSNNPIAQEADLALYYPVTVFTGAGRHDFTSISALYVAIEFVMAAYVSHLDDMAVND